MSDGLTSGQKQRLLGFHRRRRLSESAVVAIRGMGLGDTAEAEATIRCVVVRIYLAWLASADLARGGHPFIVFLSGGLCTLSAGAPGLS